MMLDQNAINAIGEQLKGKGSKKFAELESTNEQIAFQALKNEAIRFMTDINNLKVDSFNRSPLEQLVAEDAEIIYQKARERIRDKLKQQKLRQAVIRFNESINHFLDREIILTVVDDTGKIYFLKETEEEKIYLQSRAKKGRFNLKWGSVLKNAFLLDLNNEDSFLNEEFEKLKKRGLVIQQTYLLALDRFNKTKKASKNTDNFIYWHEPGTTRTYAYVNNRGILAEAYTSALFTRNANFNNIIDPHNLKYYYYNFIKNIDNRAGIVAGDISENILDKVQLAVKNKRASSQSFQNLTFIAQYIINSNELINKKDLENWFLSQEAGANIKYFPNTKMIQDIDKKVSNAIEKVLDNRNITFHYAI